MTSLSEAAAFICQQWPCFPCGADKRPVTAHGFKDAVSDPDAARRLFRTPGAALIGVATGAASNLAVVDLDVKHGGAGLEWLAANQHRLPRTRTHLTRSGGKHLLFNYPAGRTIRNSASKIGPGVDIRADGGYVIVPPSTGYSIADDAMPADMPAWLVDLLDPPYVAPRPVAPVRIASTDGSPYGLRALERECAAVANAPPGTQETTLNSAGLKLGALVAGGELAMGVAMSGLIGAGNMMAPAAGERPWSAEEVRKKVERAIHDGASSPRQAPPREIRHVVRIEVGNPHDDIPWQEMPEHLAIEPGEEPAEAPEAVQHDPETGEIIEKPHGLEVIDPRIWTGPAKAREWIVPEWVPRGVVTALYGDGGMGKSLLAQQLMSCVALGEPWLGLETTQGRALGLMCEDDPDELHRRQEAINRHMGKGPEVWENLRFVSRVGFDNILMAFDGKDVGQITSVFDQFERLCAAYRPDFVVCDTIADFFGGNENNRAQVRQFVQNSFGRLARKFNCAVLICGHPSVSGIASGNGTGGSTAWNNTVRSRMYLTKPGGEEANVNPDARLLSRKKANYAARDAEVSIIWDRGAFRMQDQAEVEREGLPAWPVINQMFDLIMDAWRQGTPWSMAPQTRGQGRYFPAVCAHRLKGEKLSAKMVERLIQDWIAEGVVAVEMVDTKTKKTGLRVLRRLSP